MTARLSHAHVRFLGARLLGDNPSRVDPVSGPPKKQTCVTRIRMAAEEVSSQPMLSHSLDFNHPSHRSPSLGTRTCHSSPAPRLWAQMSAPVAGLALCVIALTSTAHAALTLSPASWTGCEQWVKVSWKGVTNPRLDDVGAFKSFVDVDWAPATRVSPGGTLHTLHAPAGHAMMQAPGGPRC